MNKYIPMKIKEDFNMFFKPYQADLNKECKSLGIRSVYVEILKATHFFRRVEERKVDKSQLGGLVSKLFVEHMCKLMYMMECMSHTYTMKRETRLYVSYKNIIVVFGVNKFDRHYRLWPRTILTGNMVPSMGFEESYIFICLDTKKFSQYNMD